MGILHGVMLCEFFATLVALWPRIFYHISYILGLCNPPNCNFVKTLVFFNVFGILDDHKSSLENESYKFRLHVSYFLSVLLFPLQIGTACRHNCPMMQLAEQ